MTVVRIALIVLSDVLRRDAAETLARFRDLGVDVRVISGDDPDTVATLARQAGLDTSGGVISGPELEALDADQFQLAAERTAIFGRITPELKERLVGTFRDQGHYVAMTGDGVNDVLSLKRSNLAIAMGSGSQATRGVADLILIDDGFAALASAIGEGQRILNGMQDILRVFLTRILSLGLLIVSALVIGLFPVDLRNASVITLFTVGIPTALLAIWARPGRQPRETLQQTLARFVVPPAAVASFLGLLVAATVLLMADAEAGAGLIDEASVEPLARTAVTAFLVCVGSAAPGLRGAAPSLAGGRRAGLAGPAPDVAGHRPGDRLRRRHERAGLQGVLQPPSPGPARGARGAHRPGRLDGPRLDRLAWPLRGPLPGAGTAGLRRGCH